MSPGPEANHVVALALYSVAIPKGASVLLPVVVVPASRRVSVVMAMVMLDVALLLKTVIVVPTSNATEELAGMV